MIRLGWLDKPDDRYRIGNRLFEISSLAPIRHELREAVLPFLQDLHNATKTTVQLGVLDGTQILVVEKITGHRPMPMLSQPGGTIPAYCSGLGRAILAYSDPRSSTRSWRRTCPARTPRTLTSPVAILRELTAIPHRGLAVDREEGNIGVSCVAAPIFGPLGDVVAALSVTGPTGLVRVDRVGPGHPARRGGGLARLLHPPLKRPPERDAGLRGARGGAHAVSSDTPATWRCGDLKEATVTLGGGYMLPSREGHAIAAIGLSITMKTNGKSTHDAYSLFEYAIPPRTDGPPPHVHTREDESFICLAGRLDVHLGGEDFVLGHSATTCSCRATWSTRSATRTARSADHARRDHRRGRAGLVTAKVLTQAGHRVNVYDKAPDVGGGWSRTRRYPGLTTQSPKAQYSFSDFPMPRTTPSGRPARRSRPTSPRTPPRRPRPRCGSAPR